MQCANIEHIAVEDTYLIEPPLSIAEKDTQAIFKYFRNKDKNKAAAQQFFGSKVLALNRSITRSRAHNVQSIGQMLNSLVEKLKLKAPALHSNQGKLSILQSKKKN